MQLIRDAWAGLPQWGRVTLVVCVAAVLVAGMWLGGLEQILAWLSTE